MVGCDLHAETMVLKVLGADGKKRTEIYPTGPSGRRQMFKALKEEAQKAGGLPIYLAYEASGLGFKLYDEATEEGVKCFVLAPTKIEKSVQQRKNKTDERDAEQLLEIIQCHIWAGKKIPSIWIPDQELRDDRELVRARLELGEESARVRVKIRSLLRRYEVKAPAKAGKGWTKGLKSFLGEQSKKSKKLGPQGRKVLQSLIRQLSALEDETEILEVGLGELAEKARYGKPAKKLTELNGVGLLTALVFVTEMGDMGRFRNRRQVGSYLGLAPSVYESGSSGERKGHITRHGSPRLRKVLCQAVWAEVRARGRERDVYEKIAEKNPRHKKIAVVALMRRLAVRMWHVGLEAQKKAA